MKARGTVVVLLVAAAMLLIYRCGPEPGDAPPSAPPESADAPGETPAAGGAALHLRLVDDDTGEAVTASVRLWRLDLGSARLFWSGKVPVEGAAIPDLPKGRYRVQCEDQRKGAPDPPEFVVPGRETARTLPLKMPRTFRARLLVFDEEGRSVTEGSLAHVGSRFSSRPDVRPGWAPGDGDPEIVEGDSSSEVDFLAPADPVVARDGAFDLGGFEESRRGATDGRFHRFRADGSNDVIAVVSSDHSADTSYVALCVPLDVLARSVFLPNGVRAFDAGARVRALSEAEPWLVDLPFTLAQTIPVRVAVSLEGYETLAFDWRYGADTVTRRVLELEDR